MAKVKIEYDTENPDDMMDLTRNLKSTDMACFIFELANNLKRSCEYAADGDGESVGVDLVFDKIHEMLHEHNINIEELIY